MLIVFVVFLFWAFFLWFFALFYDYFAFQRLWIRNTFFRYTCFLSPSEAAKKLRLQHFANFFLGFDVIAWRSLLFVEKNNKRKTCLERCCCWIYLSDGFFSRRQLLIKTRASLNFERFYHNLKENAEKSFFSALKCS